MKLQACPKCGAQFDVSTFSQGQQFRCGACGQLMTAHAGAPAAGGRPQAAAPAAPRTPAAPSRPAAPTSASQSSVASAKSPRGPQFQPAQRAQEPARAPAPPPPPSRPSRSGRSASTPQKGPPMALIAGGGALVVVGIVVAVLMGGKGGDTPSGTGGGGGTQAQSPVAPPTPEAPKDSLAEIKRDMQKLPVSERKSKDWKEFIRRLKSIGAEGTAALADLYELYVETAYGSDDPEARKALGYVEFKHTMPEEISQTKGRPFLAAFEAANNTRWLKDDEEKRLAQEALKETQEHARRLREDRVYRAGDDIWNNILQDKLFKDQNFAVRWSAPHLICYASKDRLSELDLLSMSRSERKAKREELAAKRAQYEPLLDEKVAIYTQLYTEWNKRFKDALGLQDLTAEYGGRPDLVEKKRASFQGGVPLVVWIFDSHDSFKEFHKVKGMNLPDGVGGYFEWSTAWIYLFDERNEGDARIFEIAKNLHEGTHQLDHWFGMQMNDWRPNKKFTQSWIGEGLAEYFGAHKVKEDGILEFTGRNYTRLSEAKQMAKALKSQGKEYPVAKLEAMASWIRYDEATQYGISLGLDPRWGQNMFIYQQGSMLFEMCMDGLNGKYRDKLMAYLKSCMLREEGSEPFRRCFKIRDEDDWEVLQKDFDAYVKQMLELDISSLAYKPTKRPAPLKTDGTRKP